MKEDGECVAIWLKEMKKAELNRDYIIIDEKAFKVKISSKNLEDALPDIVHRVRSSEDYPKILELLEHHPQFVCYVEECPKGRSVTGVKFMIEPIYFFSISSICQPRNSYHM